MPCFGLPDFDPPLLLEPLDLLLFPDRCEAFDLFEAPDFFELLLFLEDVDLALLDERLLLFSRQRR